MVPVLYGNNRLSGIIIDGRDYSFEERMFKGKEYGFVTVKPGKTYAVVAKYED